MVFPSANQDREKCLAGDQNLLILNFFNLKIDEGFFQLLLVIFNFINAAHIQHTPDRNNFRIHYDLRLLYAILNLAYGTPSLAPTYSSEIEKTAIMGGRRKRREKY